VRTDGPGTGNYPRAKGTGVDEKPKIVEREAQSYMAYGASVTMATVAEVLPPLHPELRSWLAERDIEIVGDPFFKYNLIDMEHHLEVEVGFPVAEIPSVNDRVIGGVLPAGRYVSVVHVGHPAGLRAATGQLLGWAADEGLVFDVTDTERGERWGCRLEIYETTEPPEMSRWHTQLALRLADG
jgi:effector-binding domain-containing protein